MASGKFGSDDRSGRQRDPADASLVSRLVLTAMGTQECILNSSCRCSLSLSNICSWWLLLSEHSLQSSAKPKSSFIAIVASRDAECKGNTHTHTPAQRVPITGRLGYAARICRVPATTEPRNAKMRRSNSRVIASLRAVIPGSRKSYRKSNVAEGVERGQFRSSLSLLSATRRAPRRVLAESLRIRRPRYFSIRHTIRFRPEV